MKTIFVHDHIFIKEDGRYYTNGGLSYEVLKRYFDVFGQIHVVSRHKQVEKLQSNLNVSSGFGVDFVEVPEFKNTQIIKNYNLILNVIKREVTSADYVIARLPSTLGLIALKYSVLYCKPYLIEMVGCPWDAYWNHSIVGKLIAPFMYFKTKNIVRKSSYVIYVTEQFLQKRYPTRGKYIGCSDVSLAPPNEKIIQNRIMKIEEKSNRGTIKIATAAAVNVKYKGHDYVIRAISKLLSENVICEYHLAGGGNSKYLKEVAKRYNVSDRVIFYGSLSRDKLFDLFDEIDIYIQPSRVEGLPRALVEAMSRGCPALGSNTGGIPELLDSNMTFSNGYVNQIASLIKKFNKEMYLLQAIRNYNQSALYQKDILERKRSVFLCDFKEENSNNLKF